MAQDTGSASTVGKNDLAISLERMRKEQAAAPTYYPTEDEKKLVETVERKYRDKDISKRAYEKTWFINSAFIRGLHYIVFNDYTRTFEVPYKLPPHRVRLVINYMMSYFRRTKAKLTAYKPGYYVQPATTDQEDVERARLDEQVLDSELDRMEFQIKFKQDVGEGLQCGSGLFYLGWDPFAGDPLFQTVPQFDEMGQQAFHPQTGEPLTQQQPLQNQFGQHLHTGENVLEVVSPFEIEADPQATSVDDARWIMRNKVRSLQWVRDNYPEKGKYVKSEPVYLSDFYQKRLRQIVGVFGYTTEAQEGESDQDSPKDSIVVHEYWERATKNHPKGRLVVTAGKVLLFDGPNPYDHGRFPFVKWDEITIPGRFWGMAVIEQAIPLQKNLNKARSQEVENRTLVGRPKWLIPRTAKVRQSSFDSEPGEKIDYNPSPRGEKPELMQPQSISQSTMQEIQHTINDLQEIMAYHEVSRGILPSANIPAEGIALLQKTDDTSLGDTAANIDNCLQQLGRLILSNCAQFWSEERMVRAAGEGDRLEAMKVTGAELLGQNRHADYFDVRVIPGSTLLKDPEKQRQKISEYIQLQILNPVQHRDQIIKMLDTGDIRDLYADDRLDEQWAQRENELMEQGQYSVPRDFENHPLHMLVLDRFRKSERYRRLPPQIQALFDQHALMHRQMAFMNAERLAQQQMALQANVMSGPGAQVVKKHEESSKAPAGGEGAQGGGPSQAPASKGEP